jgi:citrate lyase subunit beta/citryl-CoA lyase
MPLFRTFLFAPGNHPRKVEKSLGLDADAVILDLEDAVAVSQKPATRARVVEALQGPRTCLGYIRVNALDTPFCYGDIHAVVQKGVDGIVLPKVESPAQLECADWLITQLEREHELEAGAIDLLPVIETGKGVANLKQICAAPARVRRMSFGAADYSLDMNLRWTRGEREMDHARACVAVESRAAGLEAPLDTVFMHLGKLDALRAATELARDMGFQGKLCIHPEQIGVVNEVFTPTGDEIAKARRYVAAFEEAEASGSASIQVDGYFIDYPIVEKARRTLGIAAQLEARGKL